LGGRVCDFEATLFFGQAEAEAAADLGRLLAERFAAAGAYFSRPAGAFADLAYRDKPLLVDTFRRTRKLFDPDNILNPDVPFCKEVA
jgi:FAD/FMN-containing dehydrogenase